MSSSRNGGWSDLLSFRFVSVKKKYFQSILLHSNHFRLHQVLCLTVFDAHTCRTYAQPRGTLFVFLQPHTFPPSHPLNQNPQFSVAKKLVRTKSLRRERGWPNHIPAPCQKKYFEGIQPTLMSHLFHTHTSTLLNSVPSSKRKRKRAFRKYLNRLESLLLSFCVYPLPVKRSPWKYRAFYGKSIAPSQHYGTTSLWNIFFTYFLPLYDSCSVQ